MSSHTVQRTRAYLASFSGEGWNRFWFTPIDPLPLSALRVLTGLMALYFLGGYSFDMAAWFSDDGLLSSNLLNHLTGAAAENAGWVARPSYLHIARDPALLWVMHLAGLAAAVCFTIGFASRLSNLATLVCVLAYIHRAPMLTGQFEPVLSLMLCYLCLAPTGAYFSVDRWRRRRSGDPARSWSANCALRLLQIHIAALYLLSGLTKLAGDPWWTGEAFWWLIAHQESRLVDLTFLYRFPYLFNAVTHGVVSLEIGFPLLIANRWSRPATLIAASLMWVILGLVTGLLSFSVMMLIANLCFLSPAAWRDVCLDLRLLANGVEEGSVAATG